MSSTEINKEPAEAPEMEETTETASSEVPETTDEKGKKDKKSDQKKLKAENEALSKALEAEKTRADEANDKYVRLAAEYDNFRKRSLKEKEAIYGDATADAIKGIIPIIDNLQYAQKYQNGDREKFAEGVELILRQLPETLEKMNIKMYGEAGEQFNPEIHNAVFHIEDDSYGENEIAEVLQVGYMIGEKVIRYAMVKVAN